MVQEKIIVLAKTYPELSSRHGPIVCVAGVNEYGEWRRLYPIPFEIWRDEKYMDIKFSKWDIIEVDVSEKPPPHDRRFESRRVLNWENIRVVDHIGDWSYRLTIINELLDNDVETIISSGRSLGVIRPRRVDDFFDKPRHKLREDAEKIVLRKMDEADSRITLFEYFDMNDEHLLPEVREPEAKIEELPWIGYKFYCNNPRCRGHEMMVIDWEAQQLFRRYKTVDGPVKKKFFDELVYQRDLYFILGNTWRYLKSFMIIGLFYPPQNTKPYRPLTPIFKEKPKPKDLFSFTGVRYHVQR